MLGILSMSQKLLYTWFILQHARAALAHAAWYPRFVYS